MNPKYIPNIITGLRLVLIPVLCGLIIWGEIRWALLCAILMFASDALDGFLAKRFDWGSRFGTFFDPLADKLMLLSVFSVFAWLGYVPWWFITAVILSTALLLLGGSALYFCINNFHISPPAISKVSTALQFSLIALLLIYYSDLVSTLGYFDDMLNGLMWVTVFTMVWSCIVYTQHYAQFKTQYKPQ